MTEHRRVVETERVAQQQVLRRAVQVLLAAKYVRDRHVGVVHDVGQQERGRAVGAQQHEVLDVRVLDTDLAADEVVERGGAIVRRAEAQGPTGAGTETSVTTETVVAGLPSRRLVAGLHLLRRALAVVRLRRAGELLGRGEVQVEPIGLVHGLTVGLEPQPVEHVEDVARELRTIALGVGVLHAQEVFAALLTGEHPVGQRTAGATDVQVTSR